MTAIHLPGDPQGRPPYLGLDVLMHAGFIDAKAKSLDDLCRLALNHVDKDVSFEAVGDKVLYAALYAERMRSDHPEDKLFGSVPEIDIGLWVLTWGGRKGHPRLRWMPAFIFVDSPSALMTGRELYGYPKQFGRMIRRGVADADFSVALRAVGFQKQDPDEIGREHEVLRVSPGKGAGAAALARTDPDLGQLVAPLRAETDRSGPWDSAVDTLTPPLLGMPMVFLRQMRDVTAIDEAQVTEVAAATVAPTRLHTGGLADHHHVQFRELASFPITKTLGCDPDMPITASFWLKFDFQVGVGERI